MPTRPGLACSARLVYRKFSSIVSYLRLVCKPYKGQCVLRPSPIGEALNNMLKRELPHSRQGLCGSFRRPIGSLIGFVGVCGLLTDGQSYPKTFGGRLEPGIRLRTWQAKGALLLRGIYHYLPALGSQFRGGPPCGKLGGGNRMVDWKLS